MIANSKRNCGQPLVTKLIHNNRSCIENPSIAHQLNSHFINVGREIADKLPTTNENVNQYIKRLFRDSFTFRSILVHEVYDLIMGINFNKSTIGIPKKCIKLASSTFNQSLQQGVVADILTISKVTPIDKGGEMTDAANYPPISTLSTFTQIFEKFIYNQLINYIEKHRIFFQFQFGLRKGHSSAQAVTEITNTLRKTIDNNLYT